MASHETALNLIDQSASSYLRSARHQPVQWHPWGEEAFARAQAEDKPILLDIGAVWCHWCHVMDRESYENPELAAILNQHFIATKCLLMIDAIAGFSYDSRSITWHQWHHTAPMSSRMGLSSRVARSNASVPHACQRTG